MKKLMLIIVVLGFVTSAVAQLDLTSEGQKMVKNALEEAVVMVRQNYVLANTQQEEFGRSGREYFGRAYGVALFTDCGLAMPTVTAEPWRTDNAYDKYRGSKEYTPKISMTEIRYAGKSQYEKVSYEALEYVYSKDSAVVYTKGLQQVSSVHAEALAEGEASGWLVLLCSNGNLEADETSTLTMDAHKFAFSFDKRNLLCPIEQTPSMKVKNIVGGAFFVPVYSMGQITFKYAGIMVKKGEDWYLRKTDEIFLSCEPVGNAVDTLNLIKTNSAKDSVKTDGASTTATIDKAGKKNSKKNKSKGNAGKNDNGKEAPAAGENKSATPKAQDADLSPVKK
ncbi:MAG: hypothetical protein IKO62_00785 [Bacteroidales bacterium]|nr:hypothetical protein [Bacteroidales bacterium]